MHLVRFEPAIQASEQPQTHHTLDHMAAGTSFIVTNI